MHKFIDLRSDTVTLPTEEMRRAMFEAEVGDDVYGEDPTMRQLEELGAAKVGKEAALFVPSGTMGNQIALLVHTRRGDEIILEAESHIHYYEVGAMAGLACVQAKQIKGKRGYMDPQEIEDNIRTDNIHFPRTSLICLENTHNRAGGTVLTPQQVREVKKVADKYGLPVHLDGARIFNAAAALDVDVRELTKDVDSVMFCLSKGLCAPAGSLLAGSKSFVEKARRVRKMLGGGMRQVGLLAAAGIVALEKMPGRLKDDHQNAKLLAAGLSQLEGLRVDLSTVQTNFVVVDVAQTGMDAATFTAKLLAYRIKAFTFDKTVVRMVTHKDISTQDIHYTIQACREICEAAQGSMKTRHAG